MPALFVRLPNHVGDACMCLPALDALAADGRRLALVGRAWTASLFAAYGWPVIALPQGMVAQLRALRAAVRAEPGRPQGLLFTNSFSTAAHFALAGIAATGYARSARGALLTRAIAVPAGWAGPMHTVEYYHALACAFTGRAVAVPPRLALRLTAAARQRAAALLDAAGVAPPFAVLCPVATGRHHGQVKAWSGFEGVARHLLRRGLPVVACPGPGERAAVQAAAPSATLLPETDLGTFAALLAASRLVVANDSGPGHVAAAAGAPLVSVFGVTDPIRTRPWGPRVRQVGSARGWPESAEVLSAIDAELDAA